MYFGRGLPWYVLGPGFRVWGFTQLCHHSHALRDETCGSALSCWPQILEDVSEEHARKTVTVDPHPHMSISAASIHPCHHAEVMKKLVDNMLEAGLEFSVQQ